jgi:hypothetical protein
MTTVVVAAVMAAVIVVAAPATVIAALAAVAVATVFRDSQRRFQPPRAVGGSVDGEGKHGQESAG